MMQEKITITLYGQDYTFTFTVKELLENGFGQIEVVRLFNIGKDAIIKYRNSSEPPIGLGKKWTADTTKTLRQLMSSFWGEDDEKILWAYGWDDERYLLLRLYLISEDEAKTCNDCGKEKKRRDFHRRKDVPDGKRGYCKECIAKNRKKNAEKRRALEKSERKTQLLEEEDGKTEVLSVAPQFAPLLS